MKYLKTPTFPLQGVFDSWQVVADLGIIETSKDPPSGPVQEALINQYGVNFTNVVRSNLLNQPQHSIFLDSCFHHCGGWDSYRAGPDNITQSFAMKEWYESLDSGVSPAPGEQKTWIQGKTYPCVECCGL